MIQENEAKQVQQGPKALYIRATEQLDKGFYTRALDYLNQAEKYYLGLQADSFHKADLDLQQSIYLKRVELLLGLITASFDVGWRDHQGNAHSKAAKATDDIAYYIQELPEEFPY